MIDIKNRAVFNQSINSGLRTLAVSAILIMINVPLHAFQSNGNINEEKTPSQKIDSVLMNFDSPTSPGLIVGVRQEGEWLFKKAYGMADLSQGLSITEDTKFNLGSVSKQFLGYAFAMLHSQGVLSLDDPVSDYVEDWPEFEHEVTLRHMLTHTSGTRSAYIMFGLEGRSQGKDYFPRDKAYEAIRNQVKLDFVPGEKWFYNSMAFTILADILETVTETPSEKWMQEHIFNLLDLDDTVIETEIGQIFPGLAESYETGNEAKYIESQANRAIFGAADVISTIDNMGVWSDNLMKDRLGDPKTVKIMTEPFILKNGENTGYGLGIGSSTFKGLKVYRHSGGHAGFRSYIAVFPEIEASIIILSNTTSPTINAFEIAGWYFDEDFSEKREEGENEIITGPAVHVSGAELEKYTGHFLEDQEKGNTSINYKVINDTLSYQLNYLSPYFPLIPVGEHIFYDPKFENHREFVFSDGEVSKFISTWADQVVEYDKIEKWTPSADELARFEGKYIEPGTETVYTLELREEDLIATHQWRDDRVLTPLTKNRFYGFFTILQIEFSIGKDGQPEGFHMHAADLSPFWFERINFDE